MRVIIKAISRFEVEAVPSLSQSVLAWVNVNQGFRRLGCEKSQLLADKMSLLCFCLIFTFDQLKIGDTMLKGKQNYKGINRDVVHTQRSPGSVVNYKEIDRDVVRTQWSPRSLMVLHTSAYSSFKCRLLTFSFIRIKIINQHGHFCAVSAINREDILHINWFYIPVDGVLSFDKVKSFSSCINKFHGSRCYIFPLVF